MEQNTKQHIEDCLLEILKEKSYHNISIAELCRRAGISRKTFYYHYPSVKACVDSLTQNTMTACSLYVAQHTGDYQDSEAVYSAFLEFWKERSDYLDSVHLFDRFSHLIKRYVQYAQHEENHVISGISTPEMDVDQDSLNFFVGGLLSLVMQWHLRGCDTPIPELTQKILRLIHEPLMQRNMENE